MPSTLHGTHKFHASKPYPFHFQVLEKYFKDEEQDSLVREDIQAGKRVVTLLVSVIAAGATLGIIAVAMLLIFG